jgi:DNA polymerase-4
MTVLRLIAHFDADAFFASVEQACDPRLRDRPMAVGGQERGIITAASYEARARGVVTPMPVRQARYACPELVVVSSNFDRYREFSGRLNTLCEQLTPHLERASIDEGYLDLSHLRNMPAAAEAIRTLTARIAEELHLPVSWGLAGNKRVAAIASKARKPRGFVVVEPGGEAAFLAPMDIAALPGLGPATSNTLKAAGIHTLGDLVARGPQGLRSVLGNRAESIHEAALGIDESPVTAERAPAKSLSHQRTFARDYTESAFIVAVVKGMLEELAADLREQRRRARTVTIRLRFSDFQTLSAARTHAEASDVEDAFFPAAVELVAHLLNQRRGRGVRLAGAGLTHLEDGPRQGSLFDEDATGERRRNLLLARDALRRTYGEDAVKRGSLLNP